MKRHRKVITRVIVFLLLGAIANVAVAWGCHFLSDRPEMEERSITLSELWWLAANGEDADVEIEDGVRTYSLVTEYAGIGVRDVRVFLHDPKLEEWVDAFSPYPTFVPWPRVTIVKAGVPLHSVSTSHWHHSEEWMAQNKSEDGIEITGAIVLTTEDGKWEVPMRPLWPGFAINTIFYAALLWGLFFAPGSVRRMIRRRRGLCPCCAYPIGTSPVCTECGTPIPFPLRGRVREGVGRDESDDARNNTERTTHPLAPSLKGGGNDRP